MLEWTRLSSMELMEAEKWAENLTQEIYSIYQRKYSFWKPGLKLFYSPVVFKPQLMIISYQPGGSEEHYANEDRDRFDAGDFSLPTTNDYVSKNHVMSRRIRSFFDFKSGMELLKNSVVFPLIFFRSPTIRAWRKELPKSARVEMEELCFQKTEEIIHVLQPQRILILGIETYQIIKKMLGSIQNEKILHTRGNNASRMAISAQYGICSIFAVMHPSGSRISKNDWRILQELFEKELD